MDKKIYLLSLLILFSSSAKVIAQVSQNKDSTKVFYYKGRVVNSENKPLVFAHVINALRGYATITDSTGYFKVPVVINDSIRISSIGFYTRYVLITAKRTRDSAFHTLIMQKREYDLPTVDIYELRWQVFKSEFMEEEVEEDKTAERITNWMANLIPSDELRMIYQGARGVGFSLSFKTKADKSRKKVAGLEKKYQLIAPKFNDQMIRSLTGLEGDAIYKFLRFCNFEENFLIHATEYEIMERVIKFWEEYQKKGLDKRPK
ncbi:MAG: carboxypeptidase-like regulatory domain-containing protein [Bacteroidales bacterium]|nr:carboxypeptidase-like regulatory domain-containing protein [Bacteroidales bacterium]